MRRRRACLARGAIGIVVAASVLGGGLTIATPQERQAPIGAPNVLIIVTDDQRAAGTLGVMPNVRKWFKKRGTRFTQAYVTTPLCSPMRASMMTGMYAHNHRVRKNNEGDDLPQQWTIQHLLWRNGYNTAMAGKFVNGWPIERSPQFFDHWALQQHGYYNSHFNVDGVVQQIAEYSTLFITEKSIEFLEGFEAEDPVPWYLYMAPFAAHKPYTPEERYTGAPVGKWSGNPAMREKGTHDKPRFKGRRVTAAEGRQIRRGQLRTLMSVDDAVGRTMQWLKENGELENTLAFFISDNGRSWGEHGVGGKRTPYTESVKVPLLMRWPGTVPRGAKDKRLVTNLDLAPTILRAADVKANHPLDGMSLLGDRKKARLFFEHWGRHDHGIPDWASLRTRAYQYVEYYGRKGKRIFREYYNLRRDPWQLENLLGNLNRRDDPPTRRLRRLNERIKQDRECTGQGCP